MQSIIRNNLGPKFPVVQSIIKHLSFNMIKSTLHAIILQPIDYVYIVSLSFYPLLKIWFIKIGRVIPQTSSAGLHSVLWTAVNSLEMGLLVVRTVGVCSTFSCRIVL